MQNLLQTVYDLLKQDERLISTEGELLKNKTQELANMLDEKLIGLLLSDETMRTRFFKQIKECWVFDSHAFIRFINNKEFLPDSYTSFKNKIGLVDSNENFIADTNDVVLNRPYKDCVLAGGQDSEDAKREEIFYNEILGSDQIDRLLDPKVFTNFKKYYKDGEHLFTDWTKDENGDIKDNLIIKGNNLLALHSIEKKFAGKVKLIYIDPPYNTGNDGFKYNDRFNHSTWLTFMKNRLEVARDLLKEDGSIFISIDDDESHYLKALCDEVFDRNNFVANLIWEKKHTRANDAKWFSDNHDHILVYAMDKNIWRPNLLKRIDVSGYTNIDNDDRGVWASGPCHVKTPNEKDIYPITTPSGREVRPPQGTSRRFSKKKIKELISDNRIYFGESGNNIPRYKRFLTEVQDGLVPLTLLKREEVGDNQDAKQEIKLLFPEDPFGTPKPERLLERIIEISTKSGDLVLDYHLGSGTTCAVAHKMGRQYIGIEQMDYVETIAVERMKKVIEGEQGGISKSIDRQGGGEFVYIEIAQSNQDIVEQINNAHSSQECVALYHRIKESSFINYKIDIKKIDANISEFESLSIENMKRFLISLLDQNALYVNYSEMNDKDSNVSPEDKALNTSFYA